MTRLTNDIRTGIVQRLIAHRFQAEFDALTVEHAKVAQAAYQKAFTAEEIVLMDSLPDGWLPSAPALDVRVSGKHYGLSFGGNGFGWSAFSGLKKPEIQYRRIPFKDHRSTEFSFADDSQIGRVINEHFAKMTDLQSRIEAARRAAETAVNSVSTIPALLKAWPEVEPFLPKGAAPMKLPAIRVEELNAALGLPVEDTA